MTRSKLLELLDEESFDITKALQCESYRFIWTRSFHPLICIRAIEELGNITLVTKVLSWVADLPVITQNTIQELSSEDWTRLKIQIEESEIWSYSQKKEGGMDGSTWRLECMRYGELRLLDIWKPDSEDPVRKFCTQLLNLSGLSLKESDIY